ncbi:MAG TPA: hypothetical protein VEB18_04295 [Candidatus Paceibacterota bacterium]|nr:hypothetical protein [Candidatus Paceibacterota bacterium]
MGPPIFASKQGEETERRFFDAARVRTRRTPSWFLGVRRASPQFDTVGLDALASIQRPDDPKPMSVPIQVKSSKGGKRHYYREHADAKRVKVPVLVVTKTMSPDDIRKQLYAALKPFMKVRRKHFTDYFKSLARRRLGKRGLLIKKHIKKQRRT